MASLARTSLGPRTDRTAAHAAVRNLAESYGVDLLPLELNTSLSITPLKPQSDSNGRPSADCPRTGNLPDEQQDSSTNERHDLPKFCIDDLASAVQGSGTSTARHAAEVNQTAADCSTEIAGSSSVQRDALPASDPAPTTAAGDGDVLPQAATAPDHSYLSEEEYLQYQIPLEQQLLMLEEERDILVDKLLATTEALHASEARNRESQASASQVSGLLNQLQELLRRAEVERDKAKLQLKRQRMSASQVHTGGLGGSAVVAQLAAAAPMPAPVTQHQQQTSSAAGSHATRSQEVISSSSNAPDQSTSQRWLKKHKSNCGRTSSSSLAVLEAEAVVEGESSTEAVLLPSRHSSSSSSSEGSCSAAGQVQAGENDGAAMALMPSSNDVRPPVSSIISGFESLAKQKKRQAAAKAAAASAAASRRGSGVGAAVCALAGSGALPASVEYSAGLVLPVVPAAGTSNASAAAAAVDGLDLITPRLTQDDDCSSQSSLIPQQQIDSSSVASTPTAAAVYNASPTAFAAEAAAGALGLSSLQPAKAASYAEVTKRDSSGSNSRESSRSPTKRAVCSSGKAEPGRAAARGSSFEFGTSCKQDCNSGSTARNGANSSKDAFKASVSYTVQTAAAAAQSADGSLQQPRKQPELYNPAKYAPAVVVFDQQKHEEEQRVSQTPVRSGAVGLVQQDGRVAGRGNAAASVDAAVQAVEPLGDCTAEVKAAAAAGDEASNDPISSVAGSGKPRSSNVRRRHIAGSKPQQRSADADARSLAQGMPMRPAAVAVEETGSAAALSRTVSSDRRSRGLSLLSFTVVVVCLLAGGLLQALLGPSIMHRYHHHASSTKEDDQRAQLQTELTAMQQKVKVLEQQLSNRSLACKLCDEYRSVSEDSQL